MKTNLNKFPALDPAEPLFQGLPAAGRVDSTDAKLVEVVHTNALNFYSKFGLGMTEAVGHVDFFPNGGEHMPGCDLKDKLLEIIRGELGVHNIIRKVAITP